MQIRRHDTSLASWENKSFCVQLLLHIFAYMRQSDRFERSSEIAYFTHFLGNSFLCNLQLSSSSFIAKVCLSWNNLCKACLSRESHERWFLCRPVLNSVQLQSLESDAREFHPFRWKRRYVGFDNWTKWWFGVKHISRIQRDGSRSKGFRQYWNVKIKFPIYLYPIETDTWIWICLSNQITGADEGAVTPTVYQTFDFYFVLQLDDAEITTYLESEN